MTSRRQAEWLEEYFACGLNATEAARRVGYVNPGTSGSRLLNKFADEIADRLRTKAMDAEEALERLAAQARGNVADYVTVDEDGKIVAAGDVLEDREKTIAIKKIYYDSRGRLRIELHDTQKALELILKAQGAFEEQLRLSTDPITFRVEYTGAKDPTDEP